MEVVLLVEVVPEVMLVEVRVIIEVYQGDG